MSRIESDFLGELEIPDDVYYGVQTMRGKQNFHITEMPMSQEPFFPIAFGYVKKPLLRLTRNSVAFRLTSPML